VTPPAARIAFLDLCPLDRDTFRAAAVVTDRTTAPVEFRYTSPVRPTKLQRTLWGGRLGSHLAVEVLARPLLDALDPPPGLIVVRQRVLLDLRPVVGVPVVQLLGRAEDPGCRLLADRLPPTAGKTEPEAVYLRSWKDGGNDLELAADFLSHAVGVVNPLEVFQRIAAAAAAVPQPEPPAAGG
jgi:hypothetical protein